MKTFSILVENPTKETELKALIAATSEEQAWMVLGYEGRIYADIEMFIEDCSYFNDDAIADTREVEDLNYNGNTPKLLWYSVS